MSRVISIARACVAVVMLAVSLHAVAQQNCPPTARELTAEERAQDAKQARDRGFLWRITKNGRSSYLYGTIHLGRREWMAPGPQVAHAMQSSDLVALELDPTDAELMQRLQAAMQSRPGEPGAKLPDELTQRLQAQLLAACMPVDLLNAVAPEMLGALLVAMSARNEGLDASYGIDPALAQEARRLNKTVVSLETPEMQLALLRSSDATELREGMDKVLTDLEQGRTRPMLLRMAGVWADSRGEELARYREWCDCANTEVERAALKALLDDRNPGLADNIDAQHAKGKTVFAAVGSLHMFGDAALPSLMAQRGYRVERVRFK